VLNRTYFAIGGDKHEHYTIKQQPHDAADAARLYGELEKKAASSIEQIIFGRINSLNLELVTYQKVENMMDWAREHFVAFKINGVNYNLRISSKHWEMSLRNDYWGILQDYVIPELTKALLIEISRKYPKEFHEICTPL
jgi:hypothetical protein